MSSPFDRAERKLPWLAVDLACLLALLALLALAFQPTFDTPWLWVTVMGGGTLGIFSAWLGWRLRLNTGLVTLLLGVLWFGLGGALAMPSSTTGGVVPTMRTLRGMATAPLNAWKGMLTIEPPLGETWNLLAIPLLLAMVSTTLGLSMGLRSRLPQLAWVPPVGALVLAWLLGTHVTLWPVWTAVSAVAVVLLWTTIRRRALRQQLVRQQRRLAWHQLVIGALVLVLAGGATWLAAGGLASEQPRVIARHWVDSPLDPQRYPSSLQSFRGVQALHKDDLMLSVQGLPSGARVRLATLDEYNGLTYNVGNSSSEVTGDPFRRVGARIAPLVDGQHVNAHVVIHQPTGVWVPTVGQATAFRFSGGRAVAITDNLYVNRHSGTALTTVGLQPQDAYDLEVVLPEAPDEATIKAAGAGSLEQTPVEVPDLLRETAISWTEGTRTKGEAALELVANLRQGYYSNGLDEQSPSLPGHQASRLVTLLDNPNEMVGDEEQYAVAMALMARSLGIPARVVHGYEAPSGGSGDIRGRDMRAWTELLLDGPGWVTFNPTPDHDRVLKKKREPEEPRPRPHVDLPPPPPQRPEKLPNDNNLPVDQAPRPDPPRPIDWKRVGTLVAITGVPLLTLVGPVVLILGLKARRRRLRRKHPVVPNRVAGAWSELVDRVRDLGQSPPPTATRSEQAELMVMAYPEMITEADPITMAKRADSIVFSPDHIPEPQAGAYWDTMRSAEKGVRRSVGLRRWATSRLSVRSFRRYR